MSRGSSDHSDIPRAAVRDLDKKPEPAPPPAEPKPEPIKPEAAIAELALLVEQVADQVPGAHQISLRVAQLRARLAPKP